MSSAASPAVPQAAPQEAQEAHDAQVSPAEAAAFTAAYEAVLGPAAEFDCGPLMARGVQTQWLLQWGPQVAEAAGRWGLTLSETQAIMEDLLDSWGRTPSLSIDHLLHWMRVLFGAPDDEAAMTMTDVFSQEASMIRQGEGMDDPWLALEPQRGAISYAAWVGYEEAQSLPVADMAVMAGLKGWDLSKPAVGL